MADQTYDYDVLVIGAGPGGYVAAIRAAQLGLKTACAESRETLGGTCLNRGCIPSKALLHVAEEAAIARRAADAEHLGVKVTGEVQVNLAATMAWKDGVVARLTGGVAGLLKKAKVRVVVGWG